MEIIHQGKPGRTHFLIARPVPDPKKIWRGDIIKLRHPRTNKEWIVRVSTEHWYTYTWDDLNEALVMLAFGLTAEQYKTYLQQTNQEFQNTDRIRLFMVEEIKQTETQTA